MSDRDFSSAGVRSASTIRPAKPGELGLAEPMLPDGSSENFRFVPIPIESQMDGNAAADGVSDDAAESCAVIDDGLTSTQRLALSALLCGGTLASAAARVGISVRTLYKWRHEPRFAAELNRRSGEALEASCVRARNLMLKTTQVLAESLHGHDRYRWAMKLIQARRLWDLAQTLPQTADGAETPGTSASVSAAPGSG